MDEFGNWNVDGPKKIHIQVDEMMQKAEKDWPWDPIIQNLAAYHRKNAYMLIAVTILTNVILLLSSVTYIKS